MTQISNFCEKKRVFCIGKLANGRYNTAKG